MRSSLHPKRKLLLKLLGTALLVAVLLTVALFLYVHLNREKLGLLLRNKLEETFKGNVEVEKIRLSVLSERMGYGGFAEFRNQGGAGGANTWSRVESRRS